jgi:hypothetical protein
MKDSMVIQLRSPGDAARRERQEKRRTRGIVYALGALLALVLIAIAFVSYAWYVSRGAVVSNAETAAIVEEVGLLMLLPSDEQPTIATVTNLESLADQPFFRNAKLGDVVLMYPTSQRAILYSPGENMIIEVAPIVLGPQ